jgi:hypothetical protein
MGELERLWGKHDKQKSCEIGYKPQSRKNSNLVMEIMIAGKTLKPY